MSKDTILKGYDDSLPMLEEFKNEVERRIRALLKQQGIEVSAVSARVKDRSSLEKKIDRKADRAKALGRNSYQTLGDITDVVGARVVAFFIEDADRIARLLRHEFMVDWSNSEDKADRLKAESFGYRSDHYVLQLPDQIDPSAFNAEVQVRTILQHAWAEIEHDNLGYKADTLVPRQARRKLARIAALLDAADEDFQSLRKLAASKTLPLLRAEGQAELVEEFEMAIARDALQSVGPDLVLYTNVRITTPPAAGQEVLLVIEDSGPAAPKRGRLELPNRVRFEGAFPKLIDENLREVRMRIRGLRVNANQLGVSSTLHPTLIYVSVLADPGKESPAAVEEKMYVVSQQAVARIEPGLMVRILPAEPITKPFVGAKVRVEIREGFAGAFKSEAMETRTDRVNRAGTRFEVVFSDLAENVELAVPLILFSSRPGFPRTGDSSDFTAELLLGETERAKINATDQLVTQIAVDGRVKVAWEVSAGSKTTDSPRALWLEFYVRSLTSRPFGPNTSLNVGVNLGPICPPITNETKAAETEVPIFSGSASTRRILLSQPTSTP